MIFKMAIKSQNILKTKKRHYVTRSVRELRATVLRGDASISLFSISKRSRNRYYRYRKTMAQVPVWCNRAIHIIHWILLA